MEERILTFIKRELIDDDRIDLTADDDLLGSGLIGSMAVFRLIDFLEKSFSVRIPPEEMTIDHFMTVRAMSDYVRERQAVQKV
ncbi:acyl carrier protein [Neolewinella xylanilytica]|uniref:Acyl carrier protein n=1 Tax=Neolewinella xylanilytica TaxID=1514080 RepID=A0A2S6I260_9BACT|nr:acyl carrier protein [Neolewinella xylanilytica]PPK85258.1 acyl carrier protein [Neolewinella xylanilytica]